ncbi:MAG: DUF3352 domain-containing protein [Herpetosiphonaceae bacterium]|nr:DUF3352 domain-containing protein [Herpetosiphonaceae bacterium]
MVICTHCNAPNSPSSNFCRECGTPLTPAVTAPTPRRRKWGWKRIVGLISLIVVLALGGAAAYFGPTLLRGQRTAHTLMPNDTQLFVSFNPNVSALTGAQRLQKIYGDIANKSGTVYDANQQSQDLLGFDFQRDVQPWIGIEAAIGVSGIRNVTRSNVNLATLTNEANVLVVLASRNATKAAAFLKQVRNRQEEQGELYDDDTYQGIKTNSRQGTVRANPFNAFAVVGDYVIFASNKELLDETIDRSKRHTNTLGDNLHFQHVVAALPANRIGYAYIGGDLINTSWNDVLRTVSNGNTFERSMRRQLENQMKNITALDGLGLSVALDDTGLQLDGISQYDLANVDPAARSELTRSTPLKGVQQTSVRNDAYGVLSVAFPPSLKEDVAQWLDSSSDLRQSRRDFERQLGLDVQHDILDWMEGELSAVYAGPDLSLRNSYVALRPTDKAKAQQGATTVFNALDRWSTRNTNAAGATEQIDGQTWHVVSRNYQNKPDIASGWVGDDLVLGMDEEALHAAGTGSQAAIAADTTYKSVRSKLPDTINALLYVNLPRILDTLKSLRGVAPVATNGGTTTTASREDDVLAWLRPIKGIGLSMATAVDKHGTSRARLFAAISQP